MSEWISIDVLLPEEDTVVLVTGWAYNKPDTDRFIATARRIESVFVNDDTGDDLHPPTHWMAIPEVPQ